MKTSKTATRAARYLDLKKSEQIKITDRLAQIGRLTTIDQYRDLRQALADKNPVVVNGQLQINSTELMNILKQTN